MRDALGARTVINIIWLALAGAARVPFGKEIVPTADLAQQPPGTISVSDGR